MAFVAWISGAILAASCILIGRANMRNRRERSIFPAHFWKRLAETKGGKQ